MEKLYTLKREGKRLIFELWLSPPRERKTKRPARNKNAILDLLESGIYSLHGFQVELGWSRSTVIRKLAELKADGSIEVSQEGQVKYYRLARAE